MMKQKIIDIGIPGHHPGFCRANCDDCCNNEQAEYAKFNLCNLAPGQCMENTQSKGSHILFLIDGNVRLKVECGRSFTLSGGQCYFFTKDDVTSITAVDGATVIRLDFIRRVVVCQNDFLSALGLIETVNTNAGFTPILPVDPAINDFLISIFDLPQLLEKPCFHYLRMVSLFMMMHALHSPQDLICFFGPIIRASDDFRAFVLTHYNRVHSVEEFAEMAHMSKRVFERKFAETFDETTSRWINKQKTENIRTAIRYGMVSVKELTKAFGFANEHALYKFFRNHLGESPTHVIEAIRSDNQDIRR